MSDVRAAGTMEDNVRGWLRHLLDIGQPDCGHTDQIEALIVDTPSVWPVDSESDLKLRDHAIEAKARADALAEVRREVGGLSKPDSEPVVLTVWEGGKQRGWIGAIHAVFDILDRLEGKGGSE